MTTTEYFFIPLTLLKYYLKMYTRPSHEILRATLKNIFALIAVFKKELELFCVHPISPNFGGDINWILIAMKIFSGLCLKLKTEKPNYSRVNVYPCIIYVVVILGNIINNNFTVIGVKGEFKLVL